MTTFEKVVAILSVVLLILMAVFPLNADTPLEEALWDAGLAIPFFVCIGLWYRALVKRTRKG